VVMEKVNVNLIIVLFLDPAASDERVLKVSICHGVSINAQHFIYI